VCSSNPSLMEFIQDLLDIPYVLALGVVLLSLVGA
jgi:hypothetical protein